MIRPTDDWGEVVRVLASATDAAFVSELLASISAHSAACESMQQLVDDLPRGTAALVIASEALEGAAADVLSSALAEQPAWSDVPVILLTQPRDPLPAAAERLMGSAGNITLLERPFAAASFLSIVKVALRARRRQYGVRQLLQSERSARSRAAWETRRADARERELRQSEERFRLIAHSIPQPAWMAEPNGRLFWFNERWYEFSGADAEDPKAGFRSWLAAQDPDFLPAAEQRWRLSLATGVPFDMELPLRRYDGQVRWFLTRAVPARGADGKPTLWFGTCTDITEHRETAHALRQSEERLLLAVETAQLGLWTLDPVHQRLRCSDAFCAQLGRPQGMVTYELFWSAVHPDDRTELEQRVRDAVSTSRSLDAEYRVLTPDGEERWILARGRPLAGNEGSFVQLLGVSRDVTERKHAEHRRDAVLAAERAARSEAERVARMKDEFLATLSHELRTPLNAVLGWAEVLQRTGPASQDFERGLAAITRNARLQAQLIEDLLDTSRIVSGTLALDISDVDLAEVLEAAIDSVQPTASARRIAIESSCGKDARVRGDRRRLQQIAWNLLTNAVKFSAAGATVHVALERSADNVMLEVRDQGQGIEPEFLPFLFDRFRQQDASRKRRSGGLGLGLSIVRHLVQLHGGTVTGTSDGPGTGAVFRVVLPASVALRVVAPSVAPPSADFDALARARVLAVDDEPDARELIARILRERQAIVLIAASADEALVLASREQPDLIVSDIGMPGKDGYEFIADVRRLPGTAARTPAIALTAFARAEDRQMALEAGFHRHLGKPVDSFTLLATCAELIASHRAPTTAPTEVRTGT